MWGIPTWTCGVPWKGTSNSHVTISTSIGSGIDRYVTSLEWWGIKVISLWIFAIVIVLRNVSLGQQFPYPSPLVFFTDRLAWSWDPCQKDGKFSRTPESSLLPCRTWWDFCAFRIRMARAPARCHRSIGGNVARNVWKEEHEASFCACARLAWSRSADNISQYRSFGFGSYVIYHPWPWFKS